MGSYVPEVSDLGVLEQLHYVGFSADGSSPEVKASRDGTALVRRTSHCS